MVSKARSQTLDCDSVAIHLLNKMCQVAYPKVNKVKRNLFGLSGTSGENRLCDKRLTDMAERSSQEWNFDFVNETPQAGRYVWERVRCDDVPVWYTTCKIAPFKDASSRTHAGSTSDAASQQSSSEDEQTSCDKQSSKGRQLVQTSIKDYTRVQKRRSSSRLRMKQLKNRLRRGLYTTMLKT